MRVQMASIKGKKTPQERPNSDGLLVLGLCGGKCVTVILGKLRGSCGVFHHVLQSVSDLPLPHSPTASRHKANTPAAAPP